MAVRKAEDASVADLFVSNELLAAQLREVFSSDKDATTRLLLAENVKLQALWLRALAVATRLTGIVIEDEADTADAIIDQLWDEETRGRVEIAFDHAVRLGFRPPHLDETIAGPLSS